MKKALSLIIISLILLSLAVLISFTNIQSFNQNQTIQQNLNLNFELSNGTDAYLSNFTGRQILLDLFATWCVPCKEQAALLERVASAFPSVTILSISVDPNDNNQKLLTYQQATNITWLIGRDLKSQADQMFGSYVLPTLAFFNENGTLIQLKHSVATFTEIQSWITNVDVQSPSTFYIFGLGISSTIGLPLFFFVGLYVALSPCLFPIMPITILNILKKQEQQDNLDHNSTETKNYRFKAYNWIFMLWSGILFSFGIFALIGVFIGTTLIQNYLLLNLIFGIVLIIMGYIMISPKLEELFFSRIPIPTYVQNQMQKSMYSGIDLFTLGAFYSIIALPCAGPVFIALIPLVINFNSQFLRFFSLALFALGLLLPYLILIMVTTEAQTTFIQKVRERYTYVKIITSILLILVGGLLAWPYFGGPILFTVG